MACLELFLFTKKGVVMLENLILIFLILTIIFLVWCFLFGQSDYPYFYSLPFKEKLVRRYLPLALAVIGFMGFIISIMLMVILTVIENMK